MNISKNILSLGLIAIISGVSTAQTYTGTAGTNGVTDIQSDYSMSTGDGASVSVDVPLEFELPKKLVLAIHDGISFTSNPIFSSLAWDSSDNYSKPSKLAFSWNGEVLNANNGDIIANEGFEIRGAVYTNTDNVVFSLPAANTVFTHESDPNSIVEVYSSAYGGTSMILDGGQKKYTSAGIINFGASELTETDGIARFQTLKSIPVRMNEQGTVNLDSTDRAGKYTGIQTITVSTL